MRGIEIKEVSKGYKDTKALDHVSVQFEDGKIYALLGRNGAGNPPCSILSVTGFFRIREKCW